MAHRAAVLLLFVLGIVSKGLTAFIQTQQTVMAAEGGEAHLKCQLIDTIRARLVTWKKTLPGGEMTFVASYDRVYQQLIGSLFKDRVEFTEAERQNNSIVIKNVTEEDEGCYRCAFYSDMSDKPYIENTTCLQVYELHQPVLRVRQSDSANQSVVSCSVTGRPAPTVTLSVTQRDLNFSNYSAVSVNNGNGSVTVTTTAVLSGLHANDTKVGCAGRVLSGPQTEVFVMLRDSAAGEKLSWTWIIVLLSVLLQSSLSCSN